MATPAPPGYTVTNVRNRTAGGLRGSDTIGLVLHVQAGNGELSGWFNNPGAGASSTWWAGKGGARRQYCNPDTDKFWAQAAGNSLYHSIETEGYPSEPLTAAQIESVAQALAFGHVRYGWPLRLANKPGEPGLGWHGMGGAAWGGHTGCPGTTRKNQRTQILARAKELVEGDDMPSVDDVVKGVMGAKVPRPDNTPVTVESVLTAVLMNTYRTNKLVTASLTPERLSAAVAAGVKAAGQKDISVDELAKAIVRELVKETEK